MRTRYQVPDWQDDYHKAAYAMLKSRDPLLTWSRFVGMALDQLCCDVFEIEGINPADAPPKNRVVAKENN